MSGDLTWGRAELLWTAPLALAVVLWGFHRYQARRRRLSAWLGGPAAALRLTGVTLDRFPWRRALPVAGAALLVALALGEPRAAGLRAATPGDPWDVVVALDVSRSMQAADVVPSRVAGAADALAEALDALAGHRVGLMLFAGRAYPVSPPSIDPAVVRFFLDGVDPGLVNENDEGTSLETALASALELLRGRDAPAGGRAVVLLTDGDSPAEDDAAALRAARVLAGRGVRVFAIGIGTEEGAGLTRPHLAGRWGGPILAADGAPVVSRLRGDRLAALAEAGGGRYAAASSPLELRATLDALRNLRAGERAGGRWRAPGPVFWLALAALLFLLGRGRAPLPPADREARR